MRVKLDAFREKTIICLLRGKVGGVEERMRNSTREHHGKTGPQTGFLFRKQVEQTQTRCWLCGAYLVRDLLSQGNLSGHAFPLLMVKDPRLHQNLWREKQKFCFSLGTAI